MDPDSLLAHLRETGFSVAGASGSLHIRPAGRLSDELRDAIRDRKPALLAALRRETWTIEPRPDLTGDAGAWAALLAVAYDTGGDDQAGTFGVLHGLRCCGAALTGRGGRWRLERGEIDADEWADIRQRWLLPRRAALSDLLARLGADPPAADQD